MSLERTREALRPTGEVLSDAAKEILYPDTGTTTSDAILAAALAEVERAEAVIQAARAAEDVLRAYGTGVHLIGARIDLAAALRALDEEDA